MSRLSASFALPSQSWSVPPQYSGAPGYTPLLLSSQSLASAT